MNIFNKYRMIKVINHRNHEKLRIRIIFVLTQRPGRNRKTTWRGQWRRFFDLGQPVFKVRRWHSCATAAICGVSPTSDIG